jgi:hypothetical protein
MIIARLVQLALNTDPDPLITNEDRLRRYDRLLHPHYLLHLRYATGARAAAMAAPVGSPWMWTLAFGHHEDRTPTHGYAARREAAMAAFAKSRRRR